MKTIRRSLVFVLCWSLLAYAQGNTFTKVRYNGGTVATKVDPKDWHNTLTVTSELITFKLKDGQTHLWQSPKKTENMFPSELTS